MNEQKQFKILAEIEGYKIGEVTINRCRWAYSKDGVGHNTIPNYNSHDALQRVIDGMDDVATKGYCHYITDLTGYTPHGIIKATPAQKREAILRAYGKWER